jgi:hypothetical protein
VKVCFDLDRVRVQCVLLREREGSEVRDMVEEGAVGLSDTVGYDRDCDGVGRKVQDPVTVIVADGSLENELDGPEGDPVSE